MNKYYSPNKTQMPHTSKPLEEYHRQRDALIGLNSDHFKSPNYGRGAVRRYEPRYRRRSWKRVVWRVLLGIVFFGLFALVSLIGVVELTK